MMASKRTFFLFLMAGTILCARQVEAADWHHVHLTAPDPGEASAWYAKYLGGEKMERGDGAQFGDTLLLFFRKQGEFEGSVGTGIDHIGFSFPDLAAKMTEFEEAGIKITQEARDAGGRFKYGFIEDPWGTKIEVMEDSDTLGFHHIHLSSADPAATFDWYISAFGGEKTRYKGMLDAVLYGKVWLLIQRARGEIAPTQGRSVDHIGWSVADLDAAATELKEKGVTFSMDPRPYRNLRISFIEGPDGVRIEFLQLATE